MLYDEAISPLKQKQRVATVVAHELAHQWFGNLVTPVSRAGYNYLLVLLSMWSSLF